MATKKQQIVSCTMYNLAFLQMANIVVIETFDSMCVIGYVISQ